MKKLFVFGSSFLLAGLVVAMPVVAAAGVSSVYVSAVRVSGGVGHTTDDFIELFNPTAEIVNLKGTKLVKRSEGATVDTSLKSWTSDAFIPAYSFYLWANSSYSNIAVAPDATTSGTISDDSGIALRDETGTMIDGVSWGAQNSIFPYIAPNPPPIGEGVFQRQDLFASESIYVFTPGALPRNSSLQLLPPNPDPPVQDPPIIVEPPVEDPPPVIVDPPVEDPPAAGTEPVVYPPLAINEILPNPAGTDEGQEAVELYNPNDAVVDITGWYLGDGTGNLPASNALQLNGSIPAKGYKSIVIPSGKFTLNNTGGDSVQLFSPDKKKVGSVTYTGTVGENQSFQQFGSEWLWAPSSLGQANILPAEEETGTDEDETETAVSYSGININEFYPAYGDDIATPLLEVVNHSEKEIDLAGWQVEMSSTHLKKPSEGALVVDGENMVPPGGFGTIALTNIASSDFEATGKYWILLYSPDGKSQDALNLKSIVSQLSYAKLGVSGWKWAVWSPGAENKPLAAPTLQFTELLPAYKDAEGDSFVEVQNSGSEPVYLGNLKLKIGTKSIWLSDSTLQLQEYYSVFAEDLPAALTTAGKKVLLADANDKVIASLNYPKGKIGLAFMLQPDGKWVWTAEATPAAVNVFKALPVATKPPAKLAVKPTPTIPVKAPATVNSNVLPAEESPSQPKKSKRPIWIFGIVAAILLGAAGVVWRAAKEPEVSEEVL
jgi:hypothetical protein